jgi:hypothetical protein
VPTDLFINNTLVTSDAFKLTFIACTGLTSIPAGLFDTNTLVTTSAFWGTFYSCTGLVGPIPDGLFANNTLCSGYAFYRTFYDCWRLALSQWMFYNTGDEDTRFLNKSLDFSYCLYKTYQTAISGTAPELWLCDFGTGVVTTDGCFFGAGNDVLELTNYKDIPIRMNLDVAPATYWAVGDTITGQTSGKTCIVVKKITATTYWVNQDSAGAWTLNEIVGVTGDASKLADQGSTRPTFTTVWGRAKS